MGFAQFESSREQEILAARSRPFHGAAASMGDGTTAAFVTSGRRAGRMPLQDVDVQPMQLQSIGSLQGQRLRPLGPHEVAEQIVAEARATARSMLAQAREVIAAERSRAVDQGYQEGFARGAAEADADMAGVLATCEQIGLQVAQERDRVLAENETDLISLAIAVAKRIVNAAIDVDETLVIDACRGAMRKAFQRDNLQVLANPADLELLRGAGPELARELGGISTLEFIEERRVERGSVIVRTPAGEIDGTISGKAERIELALRESLEQRRAEHRSASTDPSHG